jgi:hypothetical protein
LRRLRDRLSELLHIRHPAHDAYGFHVSLAYVIRSLPEMVKTELQALLDAYLPTMPGEIQFGAPEFCLFDDMFEFRRQFYL